MCSWCGGHPEKCCLVISIVQRHVLGPLASRVDIWPGIKLLYLIIFGSYCAVYSICGSLSSNWLEVFGGFVGFLLYYQLNPTVFTVSTAPWLTEHLLVGVLRLQGMNHNLERFWGQLWGLGTVGWCQGAFFLHVKKPFVEQFLEQFRCCFPVIVDVTRSCSQSSFIFRTRGLAKMILASEQLGIHYRVHSASHLYPIVAIILSRHRWPWPPTGFDSPHGPVTPVIAKDVVPQDGDGRCHGNMMLQIWGISLWS